MVSQVNSFAIFVNMCKDHCSFKTEKGGVWGGGRQIVMNKGWIRFFFYFRLGKTLEIHCN